MTVVEELIRVENENGLSFGDYTLNAKKKVSDFEFHGDMYKVKTYRDITKLEKNELFVYESVPGTSVFDFEETDVRTEFEVEGFEDTQITLELEAEQEYEVFVDDEVDIIHDRFPVEIIEPLTEKEYYVRGCTALLDAVGTAIEKTDNVQKHLPETHRAGKVIVVITTDGLENSSEHYTQEQVRRMIEARKECGWEFLFLGANIDAGKEAEKIGIARNRSVTYENDSRGVELNFKAVGRAVSKAAAAAAATDFIEDDWADEIQTYKKGRK